MARSIPSRSETNPTLRATSSSNRAVSPFAVRPSWSSRHTTSVLILPARMFRGSGHEHLRGSLTVPIPAADGSSRVVDIYGRKIGHGLRPTAEVHTHLTDDQPGVFNVGAFGVVEEVVLCPSVWDALTFWSHGFRNVTTTFGPAALTPDLLGAFEEFSIKRVVAASAAVAGTLLAAGLEVFVIRLPAGVDVNAFALKAGDPADALGSLIRGAEWAGRGRPPAAPVVATPTAEPGAGITPADLPDADDVDDDPDDVDDEGAGSEPAPTPAPRAARPAPPRRCRPFQPPTRRPVEIPGRAARIIRLWVMTRSRTSFSWRAHTEVPQGLWTRS